MPPPSRTRAGQRHPAPADPDGPLDAQVDAAALEADLAARSQDIAAGLSPIWAHRSLHPWEIAARVSFAAIDGNEIATSTAVARRLVDDRARFVTLLEADLATLTTGRQVVDRLVELEVAGLARIPGVSELLNATATDVAVALRRHAETAGGLVVAEAAAQGVPMLGTFVLDVDAAAQIEQLAQRVAVAPHVDLVRALRDEAVRLPTPPDAVSLVNRLTSTAGTLSDGPLEEQARNATAQADGLGRQAAAGASVPPVEIYASELLDGNTCGPCSLVDGTSYGSLAAARGDYPNGIYIDCQGRDRCRGTLVFVWATEAPPTT